MLFYPRSPEHADGVVERLEAAFLDRGRVLAPGRARDLVAAMFGHRAWSSMSVYPRDTAFDVDVSPSEVVVRRRLQAAALAKAARVDPAEAAAIVALVRPTSPSGRGPVAGPGRGARKRLDLAGLWAALGPFTWAGADAPGHGAGVLRMSPFRKGVAAGRLALLRQAHPTRFVDDDGRRDLYVVADDGLVHFPDGVGEAAQVCVDVATGLVVPGGTHDYATLAKAHLGDDYVDPHAPHPFDVPVDADVLRRLEADARLLMRTCYDVSLERTSSHIRFTASPDGRVRAEASSDGHGGSRHARPWRSSGSAAAFDALVGRVVEAFFADVEAPASVAALKPEAARKPAPRLSDYERRPLSWCVRAPRVSTGPRRFKLPAGFKDPRIAKAPGLASRRSALRRIVSVLAGAGAQGAALAADLQRALAPQLGVVPTLVPDDAAWKAALVLRNAAPGPWPLEAVLVALDSACGLLGPPPFDGGPHSRVHPRSALALVGDPSSLPPPGGDGRSRHEGEACGGSTARRGVVPSFGFDVSKETVDDAFDALVGAGRCALRRSRGSSYLFCADASLVLSSDREPYGGGRSWFELHAAVADADVPVDGAACFALFSPGVAYASEERLRALEGPLSFPVEGFGRDVFESRVLDALTLCRHRVPAGHDPVFTGRAAAAGAKPRGAASVYYSVAYDGHGSVAFHGDDQVLFGSLMAAARVSGSVRDLQEGRGPDALSSWRPRPAEVEVSTSFRNLARLGPAALRREFEEIEAAARRLADMVWAVPGNDRDGFLAVVARHRAAACALRLAMAQGADVDA